jgi:hypothetical protein
MAIEARPVPLGFELDRDDFYGAFRVFAREGTLVAPVVLTGADQLDLLYFLDALRHVTGDFPRRRSYTAPGQGFVLRSLVEGDGHRARRWAIELFPEPAASPATVLELDPYIVDRVGWDVAEFLPGVSDADLDWELWSDVLIAVRERVEEWEPVRDRPYHAERDPPRFPISPLAGHLNRGDSVDELLAFVEAQLRRLHIEPVRVREQKLVEDLVAWREAYRRESAEEAFQARRVRLQVRSGR